MLSDEIKINSWDLRRQYAEAKPPQELALIVARRLAEHGTATLNVVKDSQSELERQLIKLREDLIKINSGSVPSALKVAANLTGLIMEQDWELALRSALNGDIPSFIAHFDYANGGIEVCQTITGAENLIRVTPDEHMAYRRSVVETQYRKSFTPHVRSAVEARTAFYQERARELIADETGSGFLMAERYVESLKSNPYTDLSIPHIGAFRFQIPLFFIEGAKSALGLYKHIYSVEKSNR